MALPSGHKIDDLAVKWLLFVKCTFNTVYSYAPPQAFKAANECRGIISQFIDGPAPKHLARQAIC